MSRSRKEAAPRARRTFSPEFKVEAVPERRALGVSMAQIGRQLDIGLDVLRRAFNCSPYRLRHHEGRRCNY